MWRQKSVDDTDNQGGDRTSNERSPVENPQRLDLGHDDHRQNGHPETSGDNISGICQIT